MLYLVNLYLTREQTREVQTQREHEKKKLNSMQVSLKKDVDFNHERVQSTWSLG